MNTSLNLVKNLWIILLLGLSGFLLLALLLSLFEEPTKPFEERLAEPTKPEIQTESPFNKRERELLDMTIRGLKQPLTASEEKHLSIELLAGDGYSKTQLQQMSLDELREALIVEAMKMDH